MTMLFTHSTFLRTLLFLAAAVMGQLAAAAAEPVQMLDEGLSQWERWHGSERSFMMRRGELYVQRGGEGAEPSALLTKADYSNVELEFEFMVGRWCQTGIYLNAPRSGIFRAGLEIELSDNRSGPPPRYKAGSIFRRVPPMADAVKESGEWNICRIRLEWPMLRVEINDIVVQDLDLSANDATRHVLRRGAVGIQCESGPARFRNMTLTPLASNYEPVAMLDDGMEGWEEVRPGARWTFADGVLRSENGDGYLRFNGAEAQDFDLHFHYRMSRDANGGVFFRWPEHDPEDKPSRGHEIQVRDVPMEVAPSGSVYGIARGNDLAFRQGEWNLMQIFVRGNEVWTAVNGVPSAYTDQLEVVRPGHICLQMHKTRAWIEWKDMYLTPRD